VFVYLTIHNTIRYMIQKNKKSINSKIHVLTTMCVYIVEVVSLIIAILKSFRKKFPTFFC